MAWPKSEFFSPRAILRQVVWAILTGAVLGGFARVWVWLLSVPFDWERELAFWLMAIVSGFCLLAILLMAKSRPKFLLEIDHLSIGDGQEVRGVKQAATVLIIANVRNVGAPSYAGNWMLEVQAAGDSNIDIGSRLTIFEPFKVPTGDGRMIIFPENPALYDRSLMSIPTGGFVRGMLIFSLDIRREILGQPGTKFVLLCKDALGIIYACSASPQARAADSLPMISFPGFPLRVEPLSQSEPTSSPESMGSAGTQP